MVGTGENWRARLGLRGTVPPQLQLLPHGPSKSPVLPDLLIVQDDSNTLMFI